MVRHGEEHRPLHDLLRRLRWVVPALVVALAAVHQVVARTALAGMSAASARW
ncbi:MAG: hypothetical protein GY778_11195, partial [bacterium]|nr:hypothetical protein [bacterium]